MKKGFTVFLVIAIVFSAILVIYSGIAFNNNTTIGMETVYNFNDGWKYISNDGSLIATKTLPNILSVAKNKPFTINNIIPNNLTEDMIICFRSSHQTFSVTVDGKVIYELKKSSWIGKSPACSWHFIKIPADSNGKDISITVFSPFEKYSKYVNPIIYGSKNAIIFNIIKNNIDGFLVAFLIFLIGLILFIIHFSMKKAFVRNNNILYLSLFSILVSIWIACESLLIEFLISNPFVVYLSSYLSLMLFPVPLIFLIFENCSHQKKYIETILLWTHFINFVLLTIFQLFNFADFFETVSSTHFLLAISIIICSYIILNEIIKYKNKKVISLGIGLIIFFVFGFINIFNFYFNRFADATKFFRIGIVLYILILGAYLLDNVFKMIKLSDEAKNFEILAKTDILTGGKNRMAFEDDIIEILSTLTVKSNLILISFDLNNLKIINDTFGHMCGDTALMEGYRIIEQAFGKYGNCYRIGGDEFVALLSDCNDDELEQSIVYFKFLLLDYNKTSEFVLDIAYGYAKFDYYKDKSIFTLLNRADKVMYFNKFESKKLNQKPQI